MATPPATPLSMASPETRPWLERTRECCTLLHFALVDGEDPLADDEDMRGGAYPGGVPSGVGVEARVRQLLRAGADVHARAQPNGASSPLELARAIACQGRAAHSAALCRAADEA